MFELFKYGILISAINSAFLFLIAGTTTKHAAQRDFSQLQYAAAMGVMLAIIWLFGLAGVGVFQYLTEGLL